ncbi:hypothetical protein AMTRI_Chr04g185130 [Amborella trichopoda]
MSPGVGSRNEGRGWRGEWVPRTRNPNPSPSPSPSSETRNPESVLNLISTREYAGSDRFGFGNSTGYQSSDRFDVRNLRNQVNPDRLDARNSRNYRNSDRFDLRISRDRPNSDRSDTRNSRDYQNPNQVNSGSPRIGDQTGGASAPVVYSGGSDLGFESRRVQCDSSIRGQQRGDFARECVERGVLGVNPSGSHPRVHGNSRFRQSSGGFSKELERERRTAHGGRKDVERQRQIEKGRSHELTISHVPQLVQEIQEKLTKGAIECMICFDVVGRSASIWSCGSCFSIFHLNCVKKWAKAPTSVDLSVETTQGSNWRCPGCQSVQMATPEELRYTCFCGKRRDPPSDFYLTPHSCGEPCGKALDKIPNPLCPHLCVLQCHPGPCPPCKAFAPPQPCPCGKTTLTRRCSDRKSVPSCGQPCGKLLGCGRHYCEEACHVGPCNSCEFLLNALCFCGKKEHALLCGEMGIKGELGSFSGLFSCGGLCRKLLSCGNHQCEKSCHPGECGECELVPWKMKTCPCGKTQLLNTRKSCLDPILTCSKACERTLPCGHHSCEASCHEGACPPCQILVTQKCRCGSSSRTVPCYKTMIPSDQDGFLCDKSCGHKKNCGRHRCNERCCPLSNPKGREEPYSFDWDPHLCQMICGKKLRCGQHTCGILCHSGHCPPCLETIFTDLSCACGKTSISPPVPCGTLPPSCQHPCSVPQPCGHPASHSCHFGDCPPCTVPIAKECVGGHLVLRNIPCGSRDIRCNKLCGKTRQCGMHACARTCHPSPCDPPPSGDSLSGVSGDLFSRRSCGQVCGAPRRDCRHTCAAECHPGQLCPDQRCNFQVTITCNCGRISSSVPCSAGGSSVYVDTVYEASVAEKLPVPLQPIDSSTSSGRVPLGQRKFICDDECAKLERKRVLADAFEISTNVDALHFGESAAVSEYLTDLMRRDPKWVMAIEERCKYLVLGKGKGSPNSIRVHVFCAAPKEKRDAIRQIAERWKLSIHAAGWEPRRFLVVHVTPKSKPPARILGFRGGSVPAAIGQQAPPFDSSIDMDPRLVVALFDLPRDSDVSALILRFGGECELVWLNDRNALAVFGEPARAATALRRLDHGSAYIGAVVLQNVGSLSLNAWGVRDGGNFGVKANAWKKAVPETGWLEDSWGEEWSSGEASQPGWKTKEKPIMASRNPWNVLDKEVGSSQRSSLVPQISESSQISESKAEASLSLSLSGVSHTGQSNGGEPEEVEDWEKAYE